MGPVQRGDSRAQVVERLEGVLQQAHRRGARWVVFPELALTTFFPRWDLKDQAEIDSFYESSMPNAATASLFDIARATRCGLLPGLRGDRRRPAISTPACWWRLTAR